MRHTLDIRRIWHTIVLAGLLLAWASAASASVVFVDRDATGAQNGASWATAYRTLQAAITAAAAGDELWVAEGAYAERITIDKGLALYGGFAGTEATLAARNIAAHPTIIDATGSGTAVTLQTTTSTVTIDGFTVTRGSWGIGAGSVPLVLRNSRITANSNGVNASQAVTISGNMVVDNTSSYGLLLSGTPVVTDNTISGNGYGLYISSGADATVTGNIITANRNTGVTFSQSAASQALIANNVVNNNADSGMKLSGGAPRVLNNTVRNNSTSSIGGGIEVSSGSPVVASNVIASNSAGTLGGGVYISAVSTSTSVRLINNTIAGNAAVSGGGGVFVHGGSSTGGEVLMANTIVAFNSSGVGQDGVVTLTLRNNDVFGNGMNYQGITDPTGSAGNISADPQFAAPITRDLHIQPASPARNAGNNADVTAGWTDMDGQARIQDVMVDIGADESDGTTYNFPPVIVRVKPTGNDASDGSTWALAKRTVQAAIDLAAGGGEVWIAAGTYTERVTMANSVALLGGFAGTETQAGQRNPATNVTIIDGGTLSNSNVITVPAGTGATEIIDGLTIRHTSKVGYGIHATSAALVVRNTTLTSNSTGLYVTNTVLTLTDSRLSGNNTGLEGSFGGTVEGNTFESNTSWGVNASSTPAVFRNNQVTANGNGLNASGSPTVENNQVVDNTSSYGLLLSGTPVVTSNTISGNGYGLYISSGSDATVTDNIITANRNAGVTFSQSTASQALIASNTITHNAEGGVDISGGAPRLQSNLIRSNSVSSSGGGILVSGGSPVIANNVVAGNSAGDKGGGIYVSAVSTSTKPRIINNTVSGNAATTGGGVFVHGGTTTGGEVLMANTIVAFNTSGVGQDGVAALTLRYNDVFGNGTNYQGIADPTGSAGNISADPQFAAPITRDVHIQPTSPARNAGNNADVTAGWVDLDGQARIQGGTVDIGVDESDGTTHTLPAVVVRVKPAGNDANDGSTWALAKRTIPAAVDAAGFGGEVWVAAGTYPQSVALGQPVSLLGGFAGTETQAGQRNPATNVTIIDGGSVANTSVVTVPAGTGAPLVVDGFTLRHTTKTGNGISASEAFLTIRNNTLQNNSVGVSLQNAALLAENNRFTGNNTGLQGSYSGSVNDNTFTSNTSWALDSTTLNLEVRDNTVTQNGNGLNVSGPAVIADNQVTSNTGSYGMLLSGAVTVTGNTVTGNGYGITLSSGNAVAMTANTIGNNRSTGLIVGQGTRSNLVVSGNTIEDNKGGGVDITGKVLLLGNTIRRNQTTADGGGIRIGGGAPVIASNMVVNNTAAGKGGGVYADVWSTTTNVQFINNTVASNSAGTATAAGGLHIRAQAATGGTITVVNTIVANNVRGVSKEGAPNAIFRSNDVFGNGTDWINITDPTGTNGNVALDPKFVNQAAGDYHITAGSPLRNIGDDAAVQPGWTDIDGEARIMDAHVEIGADEVTGTTTFSVADVIRALRIAGGLSPADASDMTRLDVAPKPGTGGRPHGDGAITVTDALRGARFLAGTETTFP